MNWHAIPPLFVPAPPLSFQVLPVFAKVKQDKCHTTHTNCISMTYLQFLRIYIRCSWSSQGLLRLLTTSCIGWRILRWLHHSRFSTTLLIGHLQIKSTIISNCVIYFAISLLCRVAGFAVVRQTDYNPPRESVHCLRYS